MAAATGGTDFIISSVMPAGIMIVFMDLVTIRVKPDCRQILNSVSMSLPVHSVLNWPAGNDQLSWPVCQ